MTPEQIQLVEQSAGSLLADADRWSAAFYAALFEMQPEVRALFPDDLDLQRGKFVTEIAALLGLIGDLDRFEERAGQLGADHRGYGVRAAHYRASSAALVTSVDEVLGDASSPEVLAAWQAVHDLVAETMMSGPQRTPTA